MVLVFGGCVTTTGSSNMMSNAMQPADNTITESQNRRMIVATISDEFHAEITGGNPIKMATSEGIAPPPATYLNFFNDLNTRYGVNLVADWPLGTLGVRCLILEVEDAANRKLAISGLNRDSRIETVQPMQSFSALGEPYNDPYLKLQHNYRTLAVGESHRWATGKGVSIAVIDTGTDVSHEDLKSRIALKKNFVDTDQQTFTQDSHGTAISGVIAADTNNATGMAGIAPDAKLLALKACWQTDGSSDTAACSTFTLAKSINFATSQAVDIINLSLSGPDDPLLQRLIDKALEKHITVVAAVNPDKNRNFPANMTGVLAVDQSENNRSQEPNVLRAPGRKILATTPGNQYDFYSGSSFSTAQISGMVALIKERKPHLDNNEIFAALKKSKPVYRDIKEHSSTSSINACSVMADIIGSVCN